MNEARHLARLFFLDEAEWIEILNFGSDLAGVFGGVEMGDTADAALPCQQVLPDLFCIVADSANQADAGDNNSTHQLLPTFRMLPDVVDGVLDGADLFGVLVGDFDFKSL